MLPVPRQGLLGEIQLPGIEVWGAPGQKCQTLAIRSSLKAPNVAPRLQQGNLSTAGHSPPGCPARSIPKALRRCQDRDIEAIPIPEPVTV